MRTVIVLALAFIAVTPSCLSAQEQSRLGRGCTTATYIDKDCDGYGVGKKSSGVYPIGSNTTYTTGDMPDADDDDPAVNTTASWEAKWGGSIANFMTQRKGFTNTTRIFYIASNGDDSTGTMNDKTKPYLTANAARLQMRDLQGGVLVIRQGTYASLNLSECGNGGACYGFSGTASKPVYIMAYPGEKAELKVAFNHNVSYWPNKNQRHLTFDGITWTAPGYNLGDAIGITDGDHVTIRHCEFTGWHQIIFGNHSEDITVEENVFHDMGTHAMYFGSYGMTSYGAADFDFSDDATKYLAGTSPGASARLRVSHNVIYACGNSGFEAIHVNTYATDNVIEGNICSYSSGALGLQSGIYNTIVRNNVFFDNGRSAIALSLYGPDTQAATIRNITIENNTIWVGPRTDSIRNTNPSSGIAANDYSDSSGHWIKDVVVRNNIIVTDNWSATYGNFPVSIRRNSYPNTWRFQNNLFWSVASTASPSDYVMTVDTTAYPSGQEAGKYTVPQLQNHTAAATGNLYADPMLKAASVTYTITPWLFDFHLLTGSPAIAAGAVGSTTVDVRQAARGTPPDIGAYNSGIAPRAPRNIVLK